MRTAANKLIGNHDFTSFRASECQAKSPIKTLDKIDITQNGDEIIFEFSARSFLHHMVRNIVGTLIEIGLGKPYDIDEIFAARNRSAAGPTAPASGLYFIRADYDCSIQILFSTHHNPSPTKNEPSRLCNQNPRSRAMSPDAHGDHRIRCLRRRVCGACRDERRCSLPHSWLRQMQPQTHFPYLP